MPRTFTMFISCSLLFLISCQPSKVEFASTCLSYELEPEAHYKLLKLEFKRQGIKYSHKKGDYLCYYPADEENVSIVLRNTIPSVIPGPDFTVISHEQFAKKFVKILRENGITSTTEQNTDGFFIYWAKESEIVINSATTEIRKLIANDVKEKASLL